MDSFEQWVEAELRNADKGYDATVPPPHYAALEPPTHPGRGIRFATGWGASKAGLAASAIVALAAAGVVTGKAVTTGDPNPFDSDWGGTVTQQVQTCKTELGGNQHGIGPCVSEKAKTHGGSVGESAPPGEQGPGFVPITPPSPHPTGPPSTLPAAPTSKPTAQPSPSPTAPAPAAPTPTPKGHPTPKPRP